MGAERTPVAPRRVLIVGGVAAGASTAARLRRLDEDAQILMFERGAHVSFANCGLPYYVGDVITDEADLLLASPELFRDRFNIDVRTGHEVVEINRAARFIRVRRLADGSETIEPYDVLVLATGASSIKPDAAGLDLPGVFSVRTIPDTRRIRSWLETPRKNAVVVGGGFIGLEMAENLIHRGLNVTVLELQPQVMPPLDPEMAAIVARHLREKGVKLHLGECFTSIEQDAQRLVVHTDRGTRLNADLVVLALGVRPETTLAKAAGLEIGARGGIRVNESLQTSDPSIYAVGDVIEVRDTVVDQDTLLPLAGPANRQGRLAAEAIAGREVRFRGTQGTAIVGVLGLTVAATGASEKSLERAGVTDAGVVYLHPSDHAGYYPGATPMALKLIFSREDGRVLGAQAVGEDGVDKRIDVIATMIQMKGTVHDLAESELCYAPQFGMAKDPVNVAAMMAQNTLNGDMPLADWRELEHTRALLVDVREPDEFQGGHLNGAVNLPLSSFRDRVVELPKDRELWVYCAAGKRAYVAQRSLMQAGFDVKNLSGGYTTFVSMREAGIARSPGAERAAAVAGKHVPSSINSRFAHRPGA